MGCHSFSSQSHHRDFHRRQNPTSHSRLRRLPATRQQSDQGCFVSFSCICGVVLNRCRTPLVAAIPVARWIGTSSARTYSSNRRRAFFTANGIRQLRHVSHLGSQQRAHPGLSGTSRGKNYADHHSNPFQCRRAMACEHSSAPPPEVGGNAEACVIVGHFNSAKGGVRNQLSQAATARTE